MGASTTSLKQLTNNRAMAYVAAEVSKPPKTGQILYDPDSADDLDDEDPDEDLDI